MAKTYNLELIPRQYLIQYAVSNCRMKQRGLYENNGMNKRSNFRFDTENQESIQNNQYIQGT